MDFRTELKVEPTFSTETGIFQENHVRAVPSLRAECVSRSSSGSAVGKFFCEVAGLHPAGIWIHSQICSHVGIRCASYWDLSHNSINQRQPHNLRTEIKVTVWIYYRTVACIVSVSVRVNAGLNVDQ